MPPTGIFDLRKRLKGMEYLSCEPCRDGTRKMDAVASLVSRLYATKPATPAVNFSYSSTERTVPTPAPAPVYVERPVQPVTPTYGATVFDRGAYRSVEECLNVAAAAHVPLVQCR
jgi:hypothetical protein